MTNEFQKTSNEKIWFNVGNFEKCMQATETIVGQVVTVNDDDNNDVTSQLIESNTPQISGKKVVAKVIGGAAGKQYKCSTQCTTSLGNTYEAIGYIKITD